MKISSKILLLVALVLVAAVSTTSIIIIAKNDGYIDSVSSERVVTAAKSLYQEIEQELARAQDGAVAMGQDGTVLGAMLGADTALLNAALGESAVANRMNAAVIVDAQGVEIAGYNNDTALFAKVVQQALRKQSQTTLALGGAIEIACVSAEPIVAENGDVLGAIAVAVTFDDMLAVDELKGIHNTEFTIFAEDLRVATTIMKSGERVLGTTLGENVAKVVLGGQQYVGDADILSIPYRCAYLPLTASDGTVVGIAFAGLSKADAESAKRSVLVLVLLFVPVLIFVSLMVLYIFTQRIIRRPMLKIMTASEQLAKGNTKVSLSITSKDEIGMMAQSFTHMAEMIARLMARVGELTTAAKEGNLGVRAQDDTLKGDYGEILDGVNETLDAVVAPIKVASRVLDEMALGNLDVSVTGNYKGDHATIQNALNATIQSLKGYIGEINSALESMAQGDLRVRITSDFRGDFVSLKNSINTIAEALSDVLASINTAAEQVSLGTRQVSEGAQATAQGATEQASSLEALTSTIAKIAETTSQNAKNATENAAQAQAIKHLAENGNELMDSLQKSMDEIGDASRNISKIVEVIDEISFKTNILSLNASVEAANAGAQGKGFAVVAMEVRKLASQSADAAQETTHLVNTSISRTQEGAHIAAQTATALRDISAGVDGAADVIGIIAKSSGEQATGITQINQGIEQLYRVVQTNSATAQQAAAASEELSSQADVLKALVGRFKV